MGTVEGIESDADNSDEEDIVVGGLHYQLGKRKRYREAKTQGRGADTGPDLKMGETVQVGNMTWERIEGLIGRRCANSPTL